MAPGIRRVRSPGSIHRIERRSSGEAAPAIPQLGSLNARWSFALGADADVLYDVVGTYHGTHDSDSSHPTQGDGVCSYDGIDDDSHGPATEDGFFSSPTDCTVVSILRPTSLDHDGYVVDQSGQPYRLIYDVSHQRVASHMDFVGGAKSGYSPTNGMPADSWYAVVATATATTYDCWLGGSGSIANFKTTTFAATTLDKKSWSRMRFASSGGVSKFFAGDLDEVLVWGAALSAEEVTGDLWTWLQYHNEGLAA